MLFDLYFDPEERRNLAGNPSHLPPIHPPGSERSAPGMDGGDGRSISTGRGFETGRGDCGRCEYD
jgi:hypothetical protein